jgi:hypothetical protein
MVQCCETKSGKVYIEFSVSTILLASVMQIDVVKTSFEQTTFIDHFSVPCQIVNNVDFAKLAII